MRLILGVLLALVLGTGVALALPPQWRIKYCHNYADTTVRYNQSRLAKGCLNGFERSPRWSNNWNSHYSWCINLALDKISEAQSEASARLYVMRLDCPSALQETCSCHDKALTSNYSLWPITAGPIAADRRTRRIEVGEGLVTAEAIRLINSRYRR